jgi:hypothetical protein
MSSYPNHRHSISILSKGFFPLTNLNEDNNEDSTPLDHELRFYHEIILWFDSFNNLKKCWEPFIEPFCLHMLYEKVSIFFVLFLFFD